MCDCEVPWLVGEQKDGHEIDADYTKSRVKHMSLKKHLLADGGS
jgi:hypothetical protein